MKIARRMLLSALAVVASGCGPAPKDGENAAAESSESQTDGVDAAEAGQNPRFGVWELETDRPAPYRNVMTYEPYGEGGMKITVATTNADGESSEWGYVTMFDGTFRPVEGQEGASTAVEVVDERTNRILNRRDGEVHQVVVNVLSEDGQTIHNEYRRTLEDGAEQVTHAVYRRIR